MESSQHLTSHSDTTAFLQLEPFLVTQSWGTCTRAGTGQRDASYPSSSPDLLFSIFFFSLFLCPLGQIPIFYNTRKRRRPHQEDRSLFQANGWLSVSCSCCNNKLLQTGWLKTIEICFLTVCKLEPWNQGVNRTMLPWKALGEYPSLPLQASVAPGTSWLVAASLPSLPASSLCLLPCVSVSYKGLSLHSEVTLIQDHLILGSLTYWCLSAKILFQIRSHLQKILCVHIF